jgi:hypothetical protein
MTRQFPHPHTTLPGHDPSKVRGADCITASKCEALDVRVLKVAELISNIATVAGAGYSPTAVSLRENAETLRTIAAEIRDAATPRPRPVPESNEVIAIWNADTVTQLRDVWSGSSARRPEMEPVDRIRLLEKAMGRLLVIEARHEGDGR